MSSRLRSAGPSLLAACLTLTLASGFVRAAPTGPDPATVAVAWPPSTGVLLSEVMTGGAGASDEFIELYDAADTPADLVGDEVVYVSATGGTVTRKASWTSATPLEPGQHLLLANSAGAYSALADATYTGGLAATGGAVALRAADGTVIDAIAWGNATNGFIEGTAAPAPPAGSSLERLPGGAAGNGADTNDDSLDWLVQPDPDPQALADPPVPGSPSDTPTPTPSPVEPTPTGTATQVPTQPPTPTLTDLPVASPTFAPTPAATPTPTAAETPPDPTATPGGPTPGATPTASPVQVPETIASARSAAPGTAVLVEGVLTTPIGFTDGGHGAFLQDATAGIALYLSGDGWPALPTGAAIRLAGTTGPRYGQATIHVADHEQFTALGAAAAPVPLALATGEAGESAEGLLVATGGTVTTAPETLADGFAVLVDDGSGALRVVVGAASGIARDALRRGSSASLTGVLGQHVSSGSSGGYRLYVRGPSDVVGAAPAPTPAPSASGPGPSSSADAVSPIAALTRTGQRATIEGVVTSGGALWGVDERRVTLQDASGAILVRVPPGVRLPAVGRPVRISGTLGHYLGAPELGADASPIALAPGGAAVPRAITHAPLGPGVRWQLVVAVGTVTTMRRSTTSWRGELRLADGSRLPIGAGFAAAVPASRLAVGSRVAVTGIARPPATGSSDGRLYEMLRGPSDLVVLRRPSTGTTGTTGAAAPAGVTGSAPPDEPIDADLADLPALIGSVVRVGGVVVAGDAGQLVLDDGTAQATVRLPADAAASAPLPVGTAVTLVGRVAARAGGGGVQLELRAMADLALAGDPGTALRADSDPAAASAPPPAPAPGDAASEAQVDPGQNAALGVIALLAAAVLLLLVRGARRSRGRLDGTSRRRIRDRLVALARAAPEGPSGAPPGP